MTARRLLSLAAASLLLVSLVGPACESACGDSAPGQGESCSGTATCGSECGTRWACTDGKWSVSVDDCLGPPSGAEPPTADASTDAADAVAPDSGADACNEADAPEAEDGGDPR